MLASSTVENYLKAIYLGVSSSGDPGRLLPMGHLASALGVAPGTATTMIKTLAESGLVEYEPYAGVTLTAAGQKLAAMVVRRHRVIELFLVQVMGYGWDEVHDEAEQLEHVVSDRLIDRMDEMLGRPEVDPHGDPIPDPEGVVKPQLAHTLLTCPLNTRVTITRVIDQDRSFLRFIENHHLKPGESIEVEDRDSASDSVSVRGKDDHRITIGARAASKLLVQVTAAILLLIGLSTTASAQPQMPFGILDNSFLVEEAFNQEPGVFQNIFGVHVVGRGTWEAAFTQEWPLRTQTHQLSFTFSTLAASGEAGLGDLMVNYRWQASTEGESRPAFSPRLSLILPTGNAAKGLGNGGPGWQVNLPFSKQFGDMYLHGNAGFTHTPAADIESSEYNLFAPHVAVSGIWQLRPMLNLMLESVVEWEETIDAGTARREAVFTLAPGLRTGWNLGEAQAIVGLGIPASFAGGATDIGVFGYFSYELPFTRHP
ncbi:MAG: metal-dependent transcriptional regulator [Acidobacteria bacterium]|nr:metal-dependent transcriptional regulator [Acidobacteriota bacterium]